MKSRNFIILCVSFVLLSNCASYKAARQPDLSYNLEAQENKVEHEGITLMVKCIHLKSEMKTYFDEDLLQYGILPVQINLKNNSYPRTLVFKTDEINLINPTDAKIPLMSSDKVIDKAKKSYWRTAGWTVAFGLVGGIPSLINVSNTNEKIKADYESRMLKSGNLTRGSETEGLTFFSVPYDLNSLNGWKISVVLKDKETKNNFIINYGLSGTIVPPKERKPKADDRDQYSNIQNVNSTENNNLAYIPKASSQKLKESNFILAIFPGMLNNSSTQFISNKEITVYIKDALGDAINSNQLFLPKFSYYDLQDIRSEKISEDILSSDVTDHLWLKESSSKVEKPNIDLMCQIGNQLKVDAILTYYTYAYTDSHELFGDFSVYLINVKSKKAYFERQTSQIRYSLDKDFKSVMNKLYLNYEKNNIGN